MADTIQSGFANLDETTLASGDFLPLRDVSDTSMAATGTNKEITVLDHLHFLQTLGVNRVKHLGSTHSISSATATEVTDLTIALEAGTFTFKYWLIVRTATTTVGAHFGINFTGTGAPRMHFRFADQTVNLLAETHIMDDQGSMGAGFIVGMASSIETTTAPNMGSTVGMSATATDILCFIEGMIVVSVAGDLELWHGSETATATSVEVGSSLVVTRTA